MEILKEKARSYTYLTADDIEMYLSKFVFDNTADIKVRKLIVNAFVREVILYDDEIVITYNFTDSPEHLKLTKEHVTKTEKEIETAEKTAISSNTGSYKLCHTAPSVSVCKSFLADRQFDFRTTVLFVIQQQKYALRKSFIWKLKTEQ